MSVHFRAAVATYFKARPNQWISSYELMRVGGSMAWRTRVSEVRRLDGLRIENKIERDASGQAQSFYRFVPASLLELAS